MLIRLWLFRVERETSSWRSWKHRRSKETRTAFMTQDVWRRQYTQTWRSANLSVNCARWTWPQSFSHLSEPGEWSSFCCKCWAIKAVHTASSRKQGLSKVSSKVPLLIRRLGRFRLSAKSLGSHFNTSCLDSFKEKRLLSFSHSMVIRTKSINCFKSSAMLEESTALMVVSSLFITRHYKPELTSIRTSVPKLTSSDAR